MYRHVHKRISEHERDFRLAALPDGPTDFETDKSAPVHHSRTIGHAMGWSSTTKTASHLNLTKHGAIQTRKPFLNRTDWDPLHPKIAI